MRARSKDDGSALWIAVESSGTIGQRDIARAKESAEALRKVFKQRAVPLVYGYRIRSEDKARADAEGVLAFLDDGEID